MAEMTRRLPDAFRARPKLGMYLDRSLGRPFSPGNVEQAAVKARSASRRLLGAPLLDDLRTLDPEDVVSVERLREVTFAFPALPPLTFYGKADLIYRCRTTLRVDGAFIAPGEAGIPVIVDWKTSGKAVDHPTVRRQLALMALVTEETGLAAPHPVAGYVARVVDLSPHGGGEDRTWLVGAEERRAERQRVRRVAAAIAALPRDACGSPRRAAMPARRGPGCASCVQQRACALGLAGAEREAA